MLEAVGMTGPGSRLRLVAPCLGASSALLLTRVEAEDGNPLLILKALSGKERKAGLPAGREWFSPLSVSTRI